MHVALIANTAWWDEELPQYRQLVVGLLDEGVRVTQVLPLGLPVQEVEAFGSVVSWCDTPWPWLRGAALARLADALAQAEVDLIHGLDGRVWRGALALARSLNAPAVLSAMSALDVPLARRLRGRTRSQRVVFAAASDPLGKGIIDALGDRSVVKVVPQGVHEGQTAPAPCDEFTPLCVVVSGTGEADEEYEALFEALHAVAGEHPQTQFFLDSQGPQSRGLWRLAERNGLLPHVSSVPRRLGHRELLLRSGLLAHPQPQGRSRGLTLLAMAAGLPIIARTDPWLDHFIPGQTAWCVDAADPTQWEALLRRAIESPDQARALGESAQRWVAQQRRPAEQVQSLLELYQRAERGAIRFPGA